MDDITAIRALVAAYGERIDTGDLDGVAELFRHGAWRSGTRRLEGFDAVRAVYDDVILYDDGTPSTHHVMSNLVVEVDGDTARSRCTFTVLQARPDVPLRAVLVGRYHDEFVRVDGRWRFRVRTIHADLVGDLSRHMRRDRSPA